MLSKDLGISPFPHVCYSVKEKGMRERLLNVPSMIFLLLPFESITQSLKTVSGLEIRVVIFHHKDWDQSSHLFLTFFDYVGQRQQTFSVKAHVVNILWLCRPSVSITPT